MSRPKLKLVEDAPLDITLAMRADIQARDWSRVMIAGDRSKAVLPERIRWRPFG